MWKLAQQSHLVVSELPGGPHRLRMVTRASPDNVDQLPVGVAAHQHAAVAQPDKPVQHLDRLRTGSMITGNDDQIRCGDIGFG